MDKKLEIINVNKTYKLSNKETFHVLHDINISFNAGELVSIMGESGSGKSTLMNIIGGLDSDFTGQVIADGEELNKLKDKQLDKYRKNKIGFVFQSFNLIPHLSILENVTLSLTLSNVGEKEKVERATQILKKVGLENHLKKKPTQLSGGQKQRVAIARALINNPEIIIADEPTGALDSDTSMQILDILKEIADSGKLVIMVTHSEKVSSICSRVVEIADGRIISDNLNKNYEKSPKSEIFVEDKNVLTKKKKDKKTKKIKILNFKDKQTLSFFSAFKLSFHNMWASKTKNLLMAFGVAIGIASVILMMSFSSGITDFINTTMKSYSNPEIVTISKKSESLADSFDLKKLSFTTEEINSLSSQINTHLESQNEEFRINENTISEGFNMFSIALNAKVSTGFDETKDKEIYYLYSIPPYYTEKNVIDGEMSVPATLDADGKVLSGGGFMFSKAIEKMFPNENPIGKTVEISFTLTDPETHTPTKFYFKDKICGIMDTSILSSYMVAYIDYSYLRDLFESIKPGLFAPTTLYVNTGSAETTKMINDFIMNSDELKNKYSGSIEDQLAGMFNNMSKIIGTSLIVISSISLLVSAVMILVVLYMSVSERTKEIGVLKSIGARRKDIRSIFTSESCLIGLLSGLVGIIFSIILTLIIWAALVYTIGIAPISYRWWYFIIALLLAVSISLISGLYPANKASKLDPVESLRRE